MELSTIILDLLLVLAAGWVAGVICRRLNTSLLIGYLIVGAVIGGGGLGLVPSQQHELEYLAEAGALLLLFAVGIEFSLDELLRLSRYFLVGGSVQMLAVAVPLTLAARVAGLSWAGAMLAGAAGALSSTVLVFRALIELGHAGTGSGKRAVGILLFQDVALVPLLLVIPLLTGQGDAPTLDAFIKLAGMSLLFISGVVGVRYVISRWLVPLMIDLRSVELVVLFAVIALGAACWVASLMGLPAAVGALAAGISLGGNRLSKQIDTILLPFRETFAAVFFVSLGMLLDPRLFLREPLLLGLGLVAMLALKTVAATLAMRAVGLSWRGALGMGLGLSQLGEFSFLLVGEGVSNKIISEENYGRMLFIALGTLIATPWLLRLGLHLTDEEQQLDSSSESRKDRETSSGTRRAALFGIGLIGRQLASRLETMGVEVCMADLSPVNLYPFAQQGFRTIVGDARDPEVLERCEIVSCRLVVVAVPDDAAALDIVKAVRGVSSSCQILVRCRYEANRSALQQAGATRVVTEEAEAAGRLLEHCERLLT
ncbi:MAG: cation:proton antiporter [Pirellulales bacterium]